MTVFNQPLSNIQLEILKAFSHNLSEQELIEFKNLIAQYFDKRAIKKADEVWEEKNWTEKDVNQLLETKLRKK